MVVFGLLTNNLLLLSTIALALAIVLITIVLTSYSYLNARITPERVEIGKWKIHIDQVREIRVLRSNGPIADLIIVYVRRRKDYRGSEKLERSPRDVPKI
ncbi:hypothetical protein YN1551_2705 [Sulfolobus islandicus Y.N.15.51]|uniref:Uncharacterized protein n=1 Tax=Saccharolobus islandicus (strain Y.N.15.51 / Yellowstone \|nr:hypothetical protein YN1551_2705 [Sulfolobus islandicus Y.N.15.51]